MHRTATHHDPVPSYFRRNSLPLLTGNQEYDMFERYRRQPQYSPESIRVEDEIVRANIRMVISIANEFQDVAGNRMDMDSLIASGMYGLLGAIRQFDHRRRRKLSTFAVPRIYRHIQRDLCKARLIHVPVWTTESSIRANADPELLDLADRAKSFVNRMDQFVGDPLLAVSSNESGPEESAIHREVAEDDQFGPLANIMNQLNPFERNLVELHVEGRTGVEIAQELRMGGMRVAVMTKRAMDNARALANGQPKIWPIGRSPRGEKDRQYRSMVRQARDRRRVEAAIQRAGGPEAYRAMLAEAERARVLRHRARQAAWLRAKRAKVRAMRVAQGESMATAATTVEVGSPAGEMVA